MKAAIDAQHEFNRKQFTQVKRHALMVSALVACMHCSLLLQV